MNLEEILTFLREENPILTDKFLKKPVKVVFQIEKLEVEGIDSNKFSRTIYNIPVNPVNVYSDKNFTGKTTFIELCALALHGSVNDTELPRDLQTKLKSLNIYLTEGKNKIRIERNFLDKEVYYYFNNKSIEFNDLYNITQAELIIFIKTCFILSQNDSRDVYAKIANTRRIPEPKLQYLISFIFPEEKRNIEYLLTLQRKKILKDMRDSEKSLIRVRSELYERLKFNPAENEKYRMVVARIEAKIAKKYNDIAKQSQAKDHVSEQYNNCKFEIKSIQDAISRLNKQLNLFNSEDVISKSIMDSLNKYCPVCSQEIDMTSISDNLCPLCKKDWDIKEIISRYEIDLENEKEMLKEDMNQHSEKLLDKSLSLEKIGQEIRAIEKKISDSRFEIHDLQSDLSRRLNEINKEFISGSTIYSDLEKEQKIIQEGIELNRTKYHLIQNYLQFVKKQIYEDQKIFFKIYEKKYIEILRFFIPEIRQIYLDSSIPVLNGIKANAIQIGSLRLILSLTHLLTIQELIVENGAQLGFPLLLDEPLRHLDQDKKEKFFEYCQSRSFNQILFTTTDELLKKETKIIGIVDEHSETDKSKLDFFLHS